MEIGTFAKNKILDDDVTQNLRFVPFSFGCNSSSMCYMHIFFRRKVSSQKIVSRNTLSTTKCKGGNQVKSKKRRIAYNTNFVSILFLL